MRVAASRSGRPRAWRSSRPASRTRTTAGSGAASGRAARSCVLERRARSRRPGCARRARPRRPRARGRAARRSIVTAPRAVATRGSTPPTTLVPPPNGIAAAPASGAPVEHAARPRLVARARRRGRAGGRSGRGTPARGRGRPCRRRGRRARRGRCCRSPPASSAARFAARGSSTSSSRAARSTSAGSKPRCSRAPLATCSISSGPGLLILEAPAPELATPVGHRSRTLARGVTLDLRMATRTTPCKSACPRWGSRSPRAPSSSG